jgi:hypothetical protein
MVGRALENYGPEFETTQLIKSRLTPGVNSEVNENLDHPKPESMDP